jgi:hypothetical protein
MGNGRWVLLLLATLVVASCATTVPLASPESDAAAKKFEPPQGKANLFVSRSASQSGVAVAFKVAVDSKGVGSIVPGTFCLVALDPGRHDVTVSSGLNTTKASVDVDAGKNYFYEVTATSGGFSAQPSLGVVLLESMGKIMVQQNKRVKGNEE